MIKNIRKFSPRNLLLAIILLVIHAALVGVLICPGGPAISQQRDQKNWRHIEWVDEKGAVHTTVLSPIPYSHSVSSHREMAPPPDSEGQARTSSLPQVMMGKAEKVLSCDTILLGAPNRVKLRYVGVRGPSEKDPRFEEAFAFHKKLVQGKYINILFDESQKTQDGELLGLVFVNQLTFVNAELIRQGYAYANPQPPNLKYQALFSNLEKRAQSRSLGVWKK